MGFETNRYLSEQVAGAGTATAAGLLPTTVLNITHPDPSEVEIAEAVELFTHDWHDMVDAFPARDSLREAVFAVAENAAKQLRTRTEPTPPKPSVDEIKTADQRIRTPRQRARAAAEPDSAPVPISDKQAPANLGDTVAWPNAGEGRMPAAQAKESSAAVNREVADAAAVAPRAEPRRKSPNDGSSLQRFEVIEAPATSAQQRRKTTESQGVSTGSGQKAAAGKPVTEPLVLAKESTRQTAEIAKAKLAVRANEDPASASATKTVQGTRPSSPPERGRSSSGPVFSGILITFLIALAIAVIATANSGGKSARIASQEIVRIDGLDWMSETAEAAAAFSEAQRYCLAIEPNSWNGVQPDWSRQWRLPEIHELKGIIETQQSNRPWVVGALHSSTKAQGGYWSATPAEGQSDNSIMQTVSFGSGFAGTTPGTIPQWFRCVRGEKKAPPESATPHEAAAPPSPFAVDSSEGTVRDSRTGLVWERADSGEAVDWASAKAICKRKSRTGGPWRLPTKAELASLIGGADSDPKLRDSFAEAFANSKNTYWNWTETAVAYGKGSRDKYKIGVAPPHWGSVEYDKVEAAYHVRCVRGELPPQTPKKNTQRRSKKSENSGGGDEKPVFLD